MNVYVFGGNYTWTGYTSTNWSTSSNWSPAGVPSTNDTVTLSNGGVNSILLDGNRTITRLVISANTINLNTYELHVSGRSSLNGGAINNGNLKIRGTYAYFQGTNFNCTLDVIAGQIKFSGGTFDKTGSFEQNGSASGYGLGGCTFNDDITIKNTGTVYLRMGQDNGDTFNGKVYLYSSGGYSLQMAYGDTSYFNDTIYVNSTGSGGINFANGTYGASILGDSACFITGSSGISAGTIQFKNINQSATSKNSITASGSVLFNVYSNSFGGKVNFTAPNLVVKSTTFSDSTSLTKTGSTLTNTWEGSNTYHGVATIANGNTGTAILKLASQSGDVYNKDVYFNAGSGTIQAASVGTNTYNGNVITNGNSVTFSTNGGTFKFTGSENQTFGGGTSTLNFNKIIVDKTSGSVTLNQPITIDSLLQLTSGILYTDTLITLKATATITGANNLSFVDGIVKKIGNTAFVFPVGDESTFSPIAISAPSQTSDAFVAKYFYQSPSIISDSLDTSLYSISRCNYWSLNRVVGSSNVNVKLYWDSLGCTLFDTTNLRVAQFIGASWKSHGKSNLLGDVNIGSVENSTSLSSYGYFTLASKYIPVTVTMTLASATRPIEVDFFGFNGANTIILDDAKNAIQTWDDLFNTNVLSTGLKTLTQKHINVIRYPAGNLSNYYDWRSGWYLREKRLPNGWLYENNNYRIEPNSYTGNDLMNMADNANLIAARPILSWNILTSGFHYELASIYRLGEVNLPLNYIELGNEFYLNEEQYKEVFPSVKVYLDKTKKWIADFKALNIPQTTNVKFAILGADAGENIHGRRRMWLPTLLDQLSPSDAVDAITIHDYIPSGLTDMTGNCFTMGSQFLKTYLNKSFIDGEKIKSGTFLQIQQANLTKFATAPLKIWITEYNNSDFENSYIGTWPHGLVNAVMTLKYLETYEITKVISHTMVSNGVFGNIFESDCGFETVKCHGVLPSIPCGAGPITYKGEFTALGNALNQVALALENATQAQAIIFTGSINPINQAPAPAFPSLYGWYFSNPAGEKQVIILNLDFANKYEIPSPISFLGTSTFLYEQIYCIDPQNVIVGNPQSQPTNTFRLHLDQGILTGLLTLEEGSITRIYLQSPPLSAKLTDDEICDGTYTTLAIDGGAGSVSVSGPGLNITPLNIGTTTSDRNWQVVVPSVSTTTIFPITISCSGNSSTAIVNLTVHPNISDLIISSNNSPATALDFCPGPNNSITLEANFLAGNGVPITNSSVNDYHFIWAPDTGITANNCIGSDLPLCNEITVSPERTTKYTVYVTDDHCWQSASVVINVPINEVDLGPDKIVCANPANSVVLNPLVEASSTNLSYLWSTSEISPSITCNTASVQDDVFTVTVTDLNTGCTATDTITIHVVECCSPTPGIKVVNAQNYYFPGEVIPEYFSTGDNLYFAVTAVPSCSCAVFNSSTLQTVNNSLLTIDGIGQSLVINFGGEFRVMNDVRSPSMLEIDGFDITIKNATLEFGQDAFIHVRDGRTLTLENCTLRNCTSQMWEGIKVFRLGTENSPKIIAKNCILQNAKEAILLSRDAGYEIENILFEDNYKDIAMEKYQKKVEQNVSIVNDPQGYSQSKYIRGCTFTSSGNTLLSPYNTVHKFAGIVLNDAERVVIGDSSLAVDYNIFSNSSYGIYSNNSSFECYHSSFSDIFDLETSPLSRSNRGTSIYSYSKSDFNDRSIIIGNKDYDLTSSPFTQKNTFLKSKFGIISDGEMNAKIYNNVFGSLDVDDVIVKYGIWTRNSGIKKVYISRENEFYNYNVGIRANDISKTGTYNVGYNKFTSPFINTATPINFEGTAIWLGNNYGSTPASSLDPEPAVRIFNNIIGDITVDNGPRIGIYVAGINSPVIENNSIIFNRLSPPSLYTSGIWLQMTDFAQVKDNLILNSDYVDGLPLTERLSGIVVDQTNSPCISSNEIENTGHSMMFLGDCGAVDLTENVMTNYDESIFLLNAEIGTQGTATRADDNEWEYNAGTTQPVRVAGFKQGILALTWYYDDSALQFDPDINNNIDPLFLDEVDLNNPADPLICDPIADPLNRNLTFGPVVGDSMRYELDYQEELSYQSKRILYNYIIRNSSVLDLNDAADESFHVYYDVLKTGNLARFDTVRSFLELKDFSSAYNLVSSITDTNIVERQLISVYNLLCVRQIAGEIFSSTDSILLQEMSELSLVLFGEAVLFPRINLFLEVHDSPLGSSARVKSNFTSEINLKSALRIYPNPVNEELTIGVENIENGLIELISVTGEVVKREQLKRKVNVKDLSPGMYFIRLKSENSILMERFIISR